MLKWRRRGPILIVTISVLALTLILTGVAGTGKKNVILSPGGRYGLLLIHDEFLGQTETLTVTSRPNSRGEKEIFRRVGDQPFAFVRWRSDEEAVVELPGSGGARTREEVLRCKADDCTLGP